MSIKYIFCISPGRSGSNYLSKVLKCIEGIHSEHEPEMTMNGVPMQAYLNGDKQQIKAMMPEKFNAIEKSRGSGIYFESNHCFIKAFGWELFDYIDQRNTAVIILHREKQKVVESYSRIGSDPYGEDGINWLILPRKHNLTPAPVGVMWFKIRRFFLATPYSFLIKKGWRAKKIPSWNLKSAKLLLGWYVDETYALGEEFKKQFPEATYVDVDIDKLNSKDGVSGLLKNLGLADLSMKSQLDGVLGKPSNLKKR